MVAEANHYSLIDEPWIPCLFVDGTRGAVGLRAAIERSAEIARIEGDLAVSSFALLRLLLAVMYASLGDRFFAAEDWARVRDEGPSAVGAGEYLERFRNRFDLVHPQTPFYQVADLQTAKGEFTGLERLILDVPNGEPFQTTRSGDGLRTIALDEASRWLVTTMAFDPSGIKSGAVGDDRVKGGRGYPIGIAWTGRLGGLYFEGETLWETLLLNLVGAQVGQDEWEGDVPVWEREPLTSAVEEDLEAVGPAGAYTWPARRLRLSVKDGVVDGVLVCNGDRAVPVNIHRIEPLSRWRSSEAQAKALGIPRAYMPLAHNPSRALWRGIATLLPTGNRGKNVEEDRLPSLGAEWLAELRAAEVLPTNHLIRVRAVGLAYGSNDSVVAEQVDQALSIPLVTLSSTDPELHHRVEAALAASEDGVRALRNLAGNIAAAENRGVDGARERAGDRAYTELEKLFSAWVSSLRPDTSLEHVALWRSQCRSLLRELGDELMRNASPIAWKGRSVQGRHLSAPLAEAWFSAALHKAVGEQRTPETEPTHDPKSEETA